MIAVIFYDLIKHCLTKLKPNMVWKTFNRYLPSDATTGLSFNIEHYGKTNWNFSFETANMIKPKLYSNGH